MSVRAVILAAGKGTRVQPLTYDLPKPMVPILGKPVMEYLVEHLARHDVREIMVNTSHLGHRIENYFGDGRRHGVDIGYSFEGYIEDDAIVPDPLGSAGALRKIDDHGGFIDCTTIVVCGDAIINLDITAAVAEHRRRGALATVIVKKVALDQVSNYGIVGTVDESHVISFQEKPDPEFAVSCLASTGIYIFEPEILALIPTDRPYDIGSELFPRLVEDGLAFHAQIHEFDWIDIGRISDYWQVMQDLMSHPSAACPVPGKQVRPGVRVGLNVKINWHAVHIEGPVYIGSGAHIEDGAQLIGPLWIGQGCHIKANARVEQSVLFEYARVEAGAHLEQMIVSGHYCVTKDGQHLYANEPNAVKDWGDARARIARDVDLPQAIAA